MRLHFFQLVFVHRAALCAFDQVIEEQLSPASVALCGECFACDGLLNHGKLGFRPIKTAMQAAACRNSWTLISLKLAGRDQCAAIRRPLRLSAP